MNKNMDYKSAGVDIEAGKKAVKAIRSHVESTWGPEVIPNFGGFSGLFNLDTSKYDNPVLTAGADGVGTKLKIAFMADKHNTVGIDAVAMCVNDILVQGSAPLFFLDYIAAGKMEPETISEIVEGISVGCKQAQCALIGGETAEMPGMYKENEYDIAGFAVGVVEKDGVIDGGRIKPGDQVIALSSSGLHSNGFSLVRKIVFSENNYKIDSYIEELQCTVAEELLRPTKIYVPVILDLLSSIEVRGMAHITGGGIIENIKRILPHNCSASLKKGSWEKPAVFDWLQGLGSVRTEDMYATFNNGIGFVVVVKNEDADKFFEVVKNHDEKAFHIGQIVSGSGDVEMV